MNIFTNDIRKKYKYGIYTTSLKIAEIVLAIKKIHFTLEPLF